MPLAEKAATPIAGWKPKPSRTGSRWINRGAVRLRCCDVRKCKLPGAFILGEDRCPGPSVGRLAQGIVAGEVLAKAPAADIHHRLPQICGRFVTKCNFEQSQATGRGSLVLAL